MGRWINKKISELCHVGRGRVISQDEIYNNPGIYPVYSSQSMNNGEMGRIHSFDFEGEYVTWTTDGAYAGTVFFREGKFNCTNVCGTLKAKDERELDLLFLSYLLSTQAKKYVSYVGNPKLMNRVMAEIEMSLPEDKSEQKSIAHILSIADTAIAKTEALIAKYQRIKTGLMQDLLTKGIDEKGNIRNEKTHRFKTEKELRVPEEWDPIPLGKLADFKSGYAFKFEQLTEFGHKVVRISNLHKSDFPYWYYDGPVKENWKIKEGDILFTWAGIATSIDCVKYHGEDAIMNQHIYNFKFQNDIIKEFCYRYLQYFLPKLRLEIEGGAGQLHLTKDKIQSILIPFMNEGEMNKINARLYQIDKEIDQTTGQLEKLKLLKTGLMQDLLSGKVRVKIQEKVAS
jgi:type I restriction enzyme S subunit